MVLALTSGGMALPLPPRPQNPLDTVYLIQVGTVLDSGFETAIVQVEHCSRSCSQRRRGRLKKLN
jgi:hypothetical protein